MEKTIKYLENGEYHYATVKDVGDLAKLKTDSKDDLVTAINELFITGGEGPKKPDGYDELVDNVADAIQKQQQMTDTITNMQQSAQLSDAEMEHMKQVQEELHQEYLKAIKELNEAVDKAKADAADLDKKTSDLQDKLDETFASVDKEVSDVHKQLDSESAGLRKDLDDTKTSLESTRKDLLNNTQEFGVVNSEVKELKDKMDRRIWSTDLDPVREQVNKNTTEVSQTKDELKNKADQSSLDLVTNSVENLSTQVKENADGLKVSVKKDELGGDVARLLNDKTNLLLGTRSFSGEDNWRNRDKVTIEPGYYKGMKTAAVQVTDASIYQPYRVKANTAYTFSFFGKEDHDNPKATLVIKPIDAQNVNVDGGEQQVHIATEWQRFAVTFSVDQECEISIQIIQGPEATNNILHLAGLKLQYGQNDTPWEPNEADIAENIEHTESQFNVYSDQIAGIVKKQEKMGDTERQLDTRITETAEGLKQTSKDLQDANGKITEFNGKLESTAHGLKTEYEKYTNEAIGQISDSSLNLIHNSAFSSQDDQFESWQNISAKATVREDSNNLHWVELTQSGQGTDNPIGVTSNYFIVKQGKVTVAVDVKLGDKANLDNQNILLLELYDESKKRVDFTDVSVSQLGLSMSVLNDHNVHRGLYRLGIDRKGVKYMTVKPILHRNGDLWLTNFSARLSSIDDGGYTPNPDDVNHQILKMNTKIEEDAEHIALKANSVDVTRDIKSAVDGIQVGGVNLIPNSGTDIVIESKTTDAYPQWDNHLLYSSLQSNTTYTFSVSATNTNGVEQASVRIFKERLDGKYFNKEAAHWYFNADGKRHNFTFTTPNDAIPYDILLYAGPMGTLQGKNFVTTYHHPQLELGNKSTSWSPAPEDTSAEIKSAKDAAIQVASDQINIHVNELTTSFDDKLNKRVNEVKTASEKFTSDGIEQVVTKVTNVKNDVDRLGDAIDGIQVGGTNVLKNTDPDSFSTTESDHTWTVESGGNGHGTLVDLEPNFSAKHGFGVIGNTGGNKDFNQHPMHWNGGKYVFTVYIRLAPETGQTSVTALIRTWNYTKNTESYAKRIAITSKEWHKFSMEIDSSNFYKDDCGFSFGVTGIGSLNFAEPMLVTGTKAMDWSPAPEDISQQITNTNKKIDTQTLDSANIDNMRTQGHYFVRNLTGNPIGGWVYVDVTGNNNDRIRQDVYQDNGGKHMSRRLFGNSWSGWEQGAYISDVNNVKTEVTASVKNLGDRVTTEVNSVTTQMNNKINEINTKLDVANGKIEGKVTETQVNDILNGKGYATQSWAESNFRMKSDSIDLEVRKITDPISNKINNLQVGTRNLLHNTSDQWRTLTNNNGWLQQTTSSSCWTSVADYHGGDKFTYAAKITNNSHQQAELEGWLCDQNKNWINGQAFHAPIPKGANAYDVSVTFPITADTWYIRSWIIFTGGQAPNGDSVKVKDERLVEGATPGSWSPNPDDINQQITNTNNKIDTQTLDSANIDQMKTQGHYFVKNLTGNPIGGWVYVDVTGNNNDRIRQDVYADQSYVHKFRSWNGSRWTDWEEEVKNTDIISKINISPENIRLSSNKIEIDGDTEIKGTLKVPTVRLQGKSGMIGLDGNSGIIISSADTLFQTRVTRYGMDFLTSTNGKKEIVGGITTGANANDNNINGISIVLDTGQKLGDPYGGDFFSIGSTTSIKNNDDRTWSRAMDYDASGQLHQGGFMWYEHSTLASEGKQIRIDGANDPLYISATKFGVSAQPNYYQPTIRAGWNENTMSNAGIGFLWNQVKPFGNWDISDMDSLWFNGQEFKFTWVSHPSMMGNMRVPSFVKVDPNGGISSGISFAPGSVWSIGSASSGNITRNLLV